MNAESEIKPGRHSHRDAPKTFVGVTPDRRRTRRHRGRAAKFLARLRFERRDVLIVVALLALLALLLATRFTDRLFDSFAGSKPPGGEVALPGSPD